MCAQSVEAIGEGCEGAVVIDIGGVKTRGLGCAWNEPSIQQKQPIGKACKSSIAIGIPTNEPGPCRTTIQGSIDHKEDPVASHS